MWRQCLRQVLFLHWPIDAQLVRPHIPSELALDLYGDRAWVSLVLLKMKVWPHHFASLSLRFSQINVRTYVRLGDIRGIWFFSVHAGHRLAVATARWLTPLPYRWSPIRYHVGISQARAQATCRQDCKLEFRVTFSWSLPASRADRFFSASIRAGPVSSAQPAADDDPNLRSWLLERYHLFALSRKGRLLIGNFQHAPWSIFPVWLNSCYVRAAPFGDSALASWPSLVHFSPGLEGTFSPFQLAGKAPIR
ncbi:hypothetical protein HRbin36_02770 [bacterium HR36]|nr:hypothetical protein HRbin36_02770 [bacterium HR36]